MKIMVFPVSCLEPDDLVLHVAADQRVERAERLVVEHQLGLDRERAREAHALLHAAGQLRRERVGHVVQADQLEHLVGALAGARPSTCPGSRGRRRRCRSPCGGRAGRSAGTPSRPCAGAARGGPRRREPVTSWSPILTVPAVGSISRISVRTSVDLPEPERPMTTKTSPGQTSMLTSRTAATQPVFSRSSARGRSASGVPMTLSAFGPNTFQTPSARSSGSPSRCGGRGASGVSTAAEPCESPHGAMIYQACRASLALLAQI